MGDTFLQYWQKQVVCLGWQPWQCEGFAKPQANFIQLAPFQLAGAINYVKCTPNCVE